MKKSNIIFAILCILLSIVFAGCGKSQEVSGTIIDAGNVQALCPDTWYNSPIKDAWSQDENAVDPDTLYFIKGTTDGTNVSSYPSVRIDYYGEDNTIYDMRSMYSNVEDISFELDGVTWEGYIGEYNSQHSAILHQKDSNAVSINIYMQASNGEITLEDEDVKAIISSIDTKK